MKAFFAVLLLLIVAGMGYLIYEKEAEKKQLAVAMAAEQKASEEAQKLQRIRANEEQRIEQAIRDQRVVQRMTKHQVRQAWGTDYEKGSVSDEMRQVGIIEVWRFNGGLKNDKGVGFDSDGIVLAVWD